MDDGILLQSVEGLGDSQFLANGGEIWERLQGEKEELSQELLSEAPLFYDEGGGQPEASEDSPRLVEWQHRAQMESRLRDINDAQDRLIDGRFGRCDGCGGEIDARRLVADAAASLCLECQTVAEGEQRFRTL